MERAAPPPSPRTDLPVTVLVYAFDDRPPKYTDNLSKDVLEAMQRSGALASGRDIRIVTAVLPVDFDGAQAMLETYIDTFRPDFVLGMGQAKPATLPTVHYNRNAFNVIMTDHESGSIRAIDDKEALYSMRSGADPASILRGISPALASPAQRIGEYECNLSSYVSQARMEAIGHGGNVAFLHLSIPQASMQRDAFITQYARAIPQMIQNGADYARNKQAERQRQETQDLGTMPDSLLEVVRDMERMAGPLPELGGAPAAPGYGAGTMAPGWQR